jgi:hypothetical protein
MAREDCRAAVGDPHCREPGGDEWQVFRGGLSHVESAVHEIAQHRGDDATR